MDSLFLKYSLSANVVALSTKRHLRTFESSPYDSFNLNPYCGDNPVKVAESRRIFCEELGLSSDNFIMPHQVHGKIVLDVNENFMTQSTAEQMRLLDGVDALVTALPGVFVSVSTADCIPVLIHDRRNDVVAAIHSGWRGTVQNIVGETLSYMSQIYGTVMADCDAVIGPGISIDSFEVGDEVYEAFNTAGFDMLSIARRYHVNVEDMESSPISGKWHIDLWEAVRLQLVHSGVNASQIHVAGICTYQNVHTFFSARRLSIHSGRITNGIMIKNFA